MAMDAGLFAKVDAFGLNVVLHSDGIRGGTLRAIAELWGTDPAAAAELLDGLAATVDGPCEAWDEAVIAAEVGFQMSYPEEELDETQALQLADELRDAARLTFSARIRADKPVEFPRPLPRQQDRRHAA